jgi:PAS domain S-box-containing protein
MNEGPCGEHRDQDLRRSIERIVEQLRRVVDGRFNCAIGGEVSDPSTRKLERLANLALDATRQASQEMQAQARELIQANRQLQEQIEARELAMQALRRSESRIQTIIDAAAEGIITVNEDGEVLSFNRVASQLFGYDADQITGCQIDVIVPDCCGGLGASARGINCAACLNANSGALREATGRRKDGTSFPLELHVSEAEIDGCRTYVALVRDITEQRQTQIQSAHAQKLEAIGQLAAGIAHEINTPVQFVGDNLRFLQTGFNDLLTALDLHAGVLQSAGDAAAMREAIAAVENAVEDLDLEFLRSEIPSAIEQSVDGVRRVSRIVRSMREFSHPDSDEKQPTDLNRAIETTVTVARNEWKYVADVDLDLATDLPPVPAHAGDINQVILNLLVNAAHAIGEQRGDAPSDKGRIVIQTRQRNAHVEMRVSDTGCGIPDHARSRIFDPFFTTKEVGRGTGQGLSLARNVIVKRHGGTIDFETEVGRGTTFIIRLPLDPDRQADDPHTPREDRASAAPAGAGGDR